jgi:chromosome segregation ATPase
VATARIASAKQEAELQDLRRQVGELQQTLLTKQHDLATLRQERDGLLQASAEIQAQVVTVAESPQPEREAKAADPSMSRRLGQLESMVQALRASLEQMHKDVAKLRARSVTKGKPKPMAWAGSETGHP